MDRMIRMRTHLMVKKITSLYGVWRLINGGKKVFIV
jgi:hypothetical protein